MNCASLTLRWQLITSVISEVNFLHVTWVPCGKTLAVNGIRGFTLENAAANAKKADDIMTQQVGFEVNKEKWMSCYDHTLSTWVTKIFWL
jgi:hypothetical protein